MDAAHKLLILSTLSKRLSQGTDLEKFLAEAADKIAIAMDAARVTIYLLDKKRGELWSKVAHLEEIPEIRLKVGQGVAGHVAATGETINLPTSYDDGRFYADIDRRTGFKTNSQLCAPIRDYSGEILGVIQVLNKREGSFTSEDGAFIETLSGQLATLIENTSLYRQIKAAQRDNRQAFPLQCRYNDIVGNSAAMKQVFSYIARIAAKPITVLILGESGTGKEMIARTIHLNSPRKDKPFVKIDCASLPESLLENELFGHEQGAFTGATQKMPGKIAAAADGTLFIDEIGELPLTMQKRLLRVLQDKEYEPLGSNTPQKVKARILTATNCDLEKMVAAQKFRADLYFRIKVAQIILPPLHQRGEKDILSLAYHFLEIYSRRYHCQVDEISPQARQLLIAHHWPGNVRELEHCIESAIVLADSQTIDDSDLPLPRHITQKAPLLSGPLSLAEVEKQHILNVLAAVDNNKSQACKILGIGRNTLKRKLKTYE